MGVFDNKILVAPTINEPIAGRKIVITTRNGEQDPFGERAPWLQDMIRNSYQGSRRSVITYVTIALAVTIGACLFLLLPRIKRN